MWRLDTDPVSQGQTVTAAPSGGEQAALRGYKWQYDHIAVMVYDSLIEDDVVSLSLADPEAGQVDDLVLVRRGRMDAFQFKSSGGDTFGSTSHSEGGQVARTCVRWTSGGPRRGAVRGKPGLTTAEHRPKLTRSSKVSGSGTSITGTAVPAAGSPYAARSPTGSSCFPYGNASS
jgi:hypothetical protein